MFWQDTDITNEPSAIINHIRDHELYPIFELRVITVLLTIFREKYEDLTNSGEGDETPGLARKDIWEAISNLKSIEVDIFEKCLKLLDDEVRPKPAIVLRTHYLYLNYAMALILGI